jgi:hypothetical protein
MTATPTFSFGDKVVHAAMPEWGAGQVLSAMAHSEGGQTGQRLKVRFERAGLKTVSTLHADIRPAEAAAFSAKTPEELAEAAGADPVLAAALERDPVQVFTSLPDAASDPFRPLKSRIRATIDLYRFEDSGASLIDWAAAQSGLADPMVRFNRHELEQFFARFARERDQHLRRLLLEAKRADPATYQAVLKNPPRPVADLVRRVHAQG